MCVRLPAAYIMGCSDTVNASQTAPSFMVVQVLVNISIIKCTIIKVVSSCVCLRNMVVSDVLQTGNSCCEEL